MGSVQARGLVESDKGKMKVLRFMADVDRETGAALAFLAESSQ
jgi:hypothetical protein